jgi:tetratricopeptide (TPR) repeat protein
VALDPDFATAHAALAGAYCSHIYNNRPKCIEHYGLALQRSDRTTERERMLLKVEAESNIGKFEEAVRLSKEYLDKYPDDWITRYNLGTTLMRNSREEEAILQLEQALRLAPRHAATHINLVTCYIGLSKYKQSLASYSKAFELEPGWIANSNLNHEYGFALVKSGAPAKAREIFALAVAKPELKQLGLRSMAMLDLYEGKWRDAVVRLRESILLNHARKGALSEARDRFHLATILGARDGRQAELAELDRATAVLESGPVPQPWLAVRLGIAYARAGAVGKAARILNNVRSQVEPRNDAQAADLHRLEGELELARGNAAGGIELLLVAERESRTVQLEVASLAYAYDRSRQTDNAITAYQKLLADRDECLGWEAQHPWMAAHYHYPIKIKAC